MPAEAGFLLGYAGLLLLVAVGLDRLGRVDPSPWRSRVLAGHRRRHLAGRADAEASSSTWAPSNTWARVEQVRMHSGISLVVALAALVTAGTAVARHPVGPVGLAGAVAGAGALFVVVRVGRRLRRTVR